MIPLRKDLAYVRDNNFLQSLQNVFGKEAEMNEDDIKMIASISRLAAVVLAVAVFFISTSRVTCVIVWVLSHDLYCMTNYLHDGENSQWKKDCFSIRMASAFAKAWILSLLPSGSQNITEKAAQQVFWNGVKSDLISFKIYTAIKKKLG